MATKSHPSKKKTLTQAKPQTKTAPSTKQSVKRVAIKAIPKPFRFTRDVLRTLWIEKSLFGRLFLATTLIALLLFGATQQAQYLSTTDALNMYAAEFADKGFDATVHFGLLLTTAATGGLNTTLSETQKVYFTLLYTLIALTTIWLLRHRLADIKVSVRDAIYSAGAPIVTVVTLFFVAALQLLPMAVGLIAYSAAVSSGILKSMPEMILFGVIAAVLAIVSLYWLTGTAIAFMIGTNPGTYPIAALKAGKKVVSGRRTWFILHLLWLTLLVVVFWAVVLVPAVLLDTWLHQPVVPIVVFSIQLLTSFSVIFATSYTYLLYRKMIDEPTS